MSKKDAAEIARKAATLRVSDPVTFETCEVFDEALYGRLSSAFGYPDLALDTGLSAQAGGEQGSGAGVGRPTGRV